MQLVLARVDPGSSWCFVILAAFSVLCWIVIFAKALHLAARARRLRQVHERAFDGAGSLDALAQQGLSAFRGSPFARSRDRLRRDGPPHEGVRGQRLDDARRPRTSTASRRGGDDEVTPRVVDEPPRHDRLDVAVHRSLRDRLRHHGRVLSIGNQQSETRSSRRRSRRRSSPTIGLVARSSRHGLQLLLAPRRRALRHRGCVRVPAYRPAPSLEGGHHGHGRRKREAARAVVAASEA